MRAHFSIGLIGAIFGALPVSAEESTFRLDSLSLVHEFGSEQEFLYQFPAGASFVVLFGAQDGEQFPVVIPPNGLQLGVARAENGPPLEISLAGAGHGTLRRTAPGSGMVEFQVPVLVRRVDGLRALRYDLTFQAPVIQEHAPGTSQASGRAEMVAADEVETNGVPTGSFYAVISWAFDPLPAGFE
jgi:hypothetical protein